MAPTNRSARLGRRRDFTVLKTIPPRKFEQSVWWKDSTPLTNYFQSTGRVYVAEYTFSDCQFLSRRAPSFFLFFFLLIFSSAAQFPLLRSLYFEASRLFLAKRDDDALPSVVRAIDISRVEHSVTGSSVTFPSFEAASRRVLFWSNPPSGGWIDGGRVTLAFRLLPHRLFLFLLRVWVMISFFNYCSLLGCILASWWNRIDYSRFFFIDPWLILVSC